MKPVAYERLTPQEKRELAHGDLVGHLSDVGDEITALGNLLLETRLYVTECKKACRRDKRDDDLACKLLDAQATFDNIKDRIRTLRELKSILQTALRTP